MSALPLRARFASSLCRAAGGLSRRARRGDGAVIGGKVGMIVDPRLLARLAAGRRIALVSGTNGKTTTTRLTTAALSPLGQVATNGFGANMPAGHVSALAAAPQAPLAVLEVDERYIPALINEVRPEVVSLLNLSRDQLDRALEVGLMAEIWRNALIEATAAGIAPHVVANADDPLVVWAAQAAPNVTWVAAGQRWHDDSWCCPECGRHLERDGEQWSCPTGDLARPTPQWQFAENAITDPHGDKHQVSLQLPGQINVANATTALAIAGVFGVAPELAAPTLSGVASIAGRYAQVDRDGRQIRLLLAKNPAGWLEAFDMLPGRQTPVLLSINARGADGLDTSWLWDVDFSPLDGYRVLITGVRALDLAVRLDINNIPFTHVPSLDAAVAAVPAGPLEVIANYTAFQDLRTELGRAN